MQKHAKSNNVDALRIAGFGACMIAGFPNLTESFFDVACTLLSARLFCSIDSSKISLHGFPAPRAEKHLKKKVLDFKPDYVVFQFGSTDASCALRRKGRSGSGTGLKKTTPPDSEYYAPTPFTLIRWQATSVIGRFFNPIPTTSLASYSLAYEHMILECLSVGVTPVVLSPFVFGTRHSMNNAIRYTQSLHELCLRIGGTIFVDCIDILSKFPRSKILFCDGFHLSQFGHQLIGGAIGEEIFDDVALCRRIYSR